MKPRLIKTETEYEQALDHVYALMDAVPGSPEADELELLAFLVERYEREHYPIDPPDPIEAIKFRMDQMGLSQTDMRRYLGSASKVSEVLSGKRPLSLTMIRKLHVGLGISAEVLVRDPLPADAISTYDWRAFPFAELLKRGYFGAFTGSLQEARMQAAELLRELMAALPHGAPAPVYCRRSPSLANISVRSLAEVAVDYSDAVPAASREEYALAAWQARVLALAAAEVLPPFSPASLTTDLGAQLARLSYFDDGPRLAMELLNKKGIHLVILAHLPGTRLDGACMATPKGVPLIALTLRHDRLDNFWFTLLHELGHACLHLDWGTASSQPAFLDETDGTGSAWATEAEAQADAYSCDALIPLDRWALAKEGLTTPEAIRAFAEHLGISPAIVAGRLRWETGEWSRFGELVGQGKVRGCFGG